eukprot:4737127-Prymnesium_polylepis.2
MQARVHTALQERIDDLEAEVATERAGKLKLQARVVELELYCADLEAQCAATDVRLLESEAAARVHFQTVRELTSLAAARTSAASSDSTNLQEQVQRRKHNSRTHHALRRFALPKALYVGAAATCIPTRAVRCCPALDLGDTFRLLPLRTAESSALATGGMGAAH